MEKKTAVKDIGKKKMRKRCCFEDFKQKIVLTTIRKNKSFDIFRK